MFFNNTCISTNKITVEKCAGLSDTHKPKSWSKYAKDSSAYKKEHPEDDKVIIQCEEPSKEENKPNKIKDLLEKVNTFLYDNVLDLKNCFSIKMIQCLKNFWNYMVQNLVRS